jgi:hypothetical protein
MPAPANRGLRLHPGINFPRPAVAGDLGGCVFVVGSVMVLAAGLPEVRWFIMAALAAAVFVSCLLPLWHRRRQGTPRRWHPIDLDPGGRPH